MRKFNQSVSDPTYRTLERIRKEREIPSIQELIRSVIIPEWVRKNGKPEWIMTDSQGKQYFSDASSREK